MKNKVVIIANNSGGLYSFRNELISELIKQGNQIVLLTPFDTNVNDLRNLGTEMIETPIKRRGVNPFEDFKLIMSYLHYLKECNPNLVITYTIKPNVYGGMLCRLLKVPYVANITGLGTAFQNDGILRKLVTAMYKTGLKKAKVVFFENVENQQIFISENIVQKKQTYLLNGAGVNLEHYSVVDYPKDDRTIKFLFIGRIMKEKGVDELFSAMERLVSEGVDCTLDMLGGFEENYAEKVIEYERAGWLKYHGYQQDVRPFIANSHCFVLPSWHEGMANTNLECAAMGRPIITSKIHGCKEAVVDNVSGYLCEKKCSDDLYRVMKLFVKLPYNQKRKMGLAGRHYMESAFDKRQVVNATVRKLYELGEL
ncbi:MAG: glycosyltransferase family 4 protein [Firmicutes bacterium]|nr:glycosyltransferase family 4 protein [Bacillota bacterium]